MGCVSSTKRPTNSLILHFTGINKPKPPKKCKSKFELFESSSIVSVQTCLTTTDTILKLKKLIKKIYSIPPKHNLLILYSHHIISNDDRLTLLDFGITNRSLLLIAIKASPTTPKRIPSFISETNTLDLEDDFEIFENNIYAEDYNINPLNTINITRPRPTLLTLSTFEDESNTFEDTNSDIFTSPRIPDSLESISNNAVFHQTHRHNNYNSLPNIFEGNENGDSDLEASYTTSCTPTFEPEERAEEKAAMLHYNSHDTTEMKRAALYASNDTIISTTFESLDSEYTITFDNDRDEHILKNSFESVIQMNSPVPFQRKTQRGPVVKQLITRVSIPMSNNSSMRSLSTLSTTYSAQNNASINVEPVHTRHAYSTTNTNTSVPVTRVHYRNASDNTEHKTSEIMLSPTVSATWSTSIDIESKKQFNLNDMNDSESDIEDINEYKASLKPFKGFDIIMQESDVDVYTMPNCKHVMNKDSLYYYALNKFTDKNNIYLTCPHTHTHEIDEIKCNLNEWSCMHCTFINDITNNLCEICDNVKTAIEKKKFCNAKWNYSLIKQILYSDNIDFEDDSNNIKLVKLELLSARNKIEKYCDVQKCPKCETLYFKDNKINNRMNHDDFKTKCICCNGNDNYFCWGCGKLWAENTHACDTSFRTELVKILKTASRKKIGDVNNVPAMRACPHCTQIITHTEACKHMKCKSCKKDFCFVCLKMKKNGNWLCGSSSSPCPIAPIQNEKTLPNAVLINKKTFTLF